MEFRTRFSKWTEIVNSALDSYIVLKDAPESIIYKAMKYSLSAGGKRLRPILALAVCEMLGGDERDILPYACAIEMIHTYSLIHDDLPAMDNDDFRRGRPANHKVFGEAIAILAGDALLNQAFELMLQYTLSGDDRLVGRIEAMGIIARSSGTAGMIGGQVVDLESESRKITGDTLEYMHKCKTGALLKAPVLAAAALCGAGHDETERLDAYAAKIGLAFQIKVDKMDVEGSV
ncbi:MAG: polyprenyl synthetase family protein [Ruminiclostridium sp.]|nr:polyprenyl synthetase family protein [Ruminiclostridium sp.]